MVRKFVSIPFMQRIDLLHVNENEADINVSLLRYRKNWEEINEGTPTRWGAPIRTRGLRIRRRFMVKTIKLRGKKR
jgi:hypothetical protein